jgi:superfamily I DNA and RNA helicase
MEKPGRGESQWEVWQSIKRSVKTDWAAGYYNYPIRDAHNRFNHSPDIFLLHADLGLVVFTCRDYRIDDLESVTNEQWTLNGDTDYPISEVESQLARIQSQITGVRELMDLARTVPLVAAVALPYISKEDWKEAGFPELNGTILFSSEFESSALNERLDAEGDGESMSEEQFKIARRRVNQGDILSANRRPIAEEELIHTKRDLYRAATWGFELHEQDKQQEQIGLHIPPGPQQIRGIAGSGKTTIMAKKAAVMHTERPDWDIVFTFNTRSLYQTIREAIGHFYGDLSGGEEFEDNLRVWHAWGQSPSNTGPNEQHEGLYREIAKKTGISPYRIIHNWMGSPSLEDHCKDLLESDKDIPELFDAILIDEAQDFGPYFYRMCYEALKEPKRLIWAYDEAQSLTKLSAPSPKMIFEDTQSQGRNVDMSGFYEGGVNKSFVMRQSYRTPREVLMAGHALGMGLYRDEGIVNTLTTKDDWRAIGYEVSDNSNFSNIGSKIQIFRNKELSPHPIQSHVDPGELIASTFCESFEEEAAEVAEQVVTDISEEGLNPQQIMIVCVGPYDYSNNPSNETARNVRAARIAKKLNSVAENKLERTESQQLAHIPSTGSRDEFWKEGQVTVSGINRAKGNEAASVYIVGAEQIPKSNWERILIENNTLRWRNNYVQVRNEVFVGLSRSEGWCHIFGVGDTENDFLNEVNEIIDIVSQHEPTFVFSAPDPKEMSGEISLDDTVPRELDYFS